MAGVRLGGSRVLCVGLLRAALSIRRAPDSEGRRLRRFAHRRRDPRAPWHADRTRPGLAVPHPRRGREPGPVPAHARRRVRRWRARAAGEDRHGRAQHHDARPGAVPHPPRASSPHRRCVVHLPDVRLRAPAVRCDRGGHPLALHPRIRGPPSALRLVHRAGGDRAPAEAVRVRAAQPELHGDEQAQAAAAGGPEARERLGRPAHAHHLGAAPPRLHPGIDPRLLHARRRGEEGERDRHGPARALRARGSQQVGAARDGGAASA